jgi:ferredoxin
MKIFYLTSTGNNLHIAKELGGELHSIPKILKGDKIEFEDDAIGIVFPCYYFGTPRLVKKFLEKVTLKSDYIFAVMSYGNLSAGGTNHFLKVAKKAGINISYFNEIVMIDNYLPVFNMEHQIKKAPSKNIKNNLAAIVSDIRSKNIYIDKKSLLSNISTFIVQLFYKLSVRKADKRFYVEDSCNSCKICEKVCPVDNIQVDVKPNYLHHCEECLACAHHCPQNSIRIKKERSKARYINENVNLNEIIEANN